MQVAQKYTAVLWGKRLATSSLTPEAKAHLGQEQAKLSNGGKRTGALLLPAKHAAPRHLDRKVEDPHEQEVVDSAASTHEEHQRVSHKQDGDGAEQEHADHESPHLEQHNCVMEERHEELERGEACMACGCQWSRDHHEKETSPRGRSPSRAHTPQ